MSKAQDLFQQRKDFGIATEARFLSAVEGAETLESYYGNILSEDDIELALQKYGDNFSAIQQEFIEKTRLQGADIAFLFFGVLLHVAKTVIINKLTEIERANSKGGREEKLHDFQEKLLKKFSNGEEATVENLNASLEAIITTRGVPYDATAYKYDKLKIFEKANHRFSTLGHDPALGLIFGTANILTSTITTNKLKTYHVEYDDLIKNPKISTPVGVSLDGTFIMLKEAAKRINGDIKSVIAAIIKQLIHIATDLYTPCGIQLPGVGLILDKASVEKLTKYVSTGDVLKAGASASSAVLINLLIAVIHGCKLIYENNDAAEDEYSLELYQARTKKIVMYSNVIASSSNVITTLISKNIKTLDIGGIAAMLYTVFNDTKFICKLEYEYLNSGLSKLYSEKYDEVKYLYGE